MSDSDNPQDDPHARVDVQIPDDHGYIFCAKHLCRQKFDTNKMRECFSDCPFFAGSAQGQGVECCYDPIILNVLSPKTRNTDQQRADDYKQMIHLDDEKESIRQRWGFHHADRK